MKRSYDYFKTLKKMNELVCGAFSSVADSKGCESYRFSFSAEKSELTDNLKNEFITPIERGDIFLLSECMSVELGNAESLYEYSSFLFDDCFGFSETLKKCLINRGEILNRIGSPKNSDKLIKPCTEEILTCNRLIVSITKGIKNVVLRNESHALIKYAVYTAYLDLTKSVSNTFSEMERIIIDNS